MYTQIRLRSDSRRSKQGPHLLLLSFLFVVTMVSTAWAQASEHFEAEPPDARVREMERLQAEMEKAGYEAEKAQAEAEKARAELERARLGESKESPKPLKYNVVPFNLGLFPPAQINSAFDGPVLNNVSLGFFATEQDALRGLALSLFVNVTHRDSKGVTASLVNVTLDDVTGLSASGLVDYVAADVVGLQMGWLYTHAGGDLKGVQLSGLGSLALGDVTGVQWGYVFAAAKGDATGWQSGLLALTLGDVRGLQTGLVTHAHDLKGLQFGLVHVVSGDRFTGAQLGLVNVAAVEQARAAQIGLVNVDTGRHRGLQLGLVNYADDVDVPIGLLSIVKKGMLHGNFWSSDTAVVNMGLKLGSRYIYNIYTIGMQPLVAERTLQYGMGLGGHIPINERWFIDTDILTLRINATDDFSEAAYMSKWRVLAGWQVDERVALIFGPTLNVSWYEADGLSHKDASFLPQFKVGSYADTSVRLAPGFVVGVQI